MSRSQPEDIARRHELDTELKIVDRRLREQEVALAEPKRVLEERTKACYRTQQEIDALLQPVRRPARAVYVDGPRRLDRGQLGLSAEALWFKGWYGRRSVQLENVLHVELGASVLPARIGIPFIGTRWPGAQRKGETLIVHTGAPGSPPTAQMVVADLTGAAEWQRHIQDLRGRVDDVATRRRSLQDRLLAQNVSRQEAEAIVRDIQTRIEGFKSRKAELQSELRKIGQRR
jgi:hypothetical protein